MKKYLLLLAIVLLVFVSFGQAHALLLYEQPVLNENDRGPFSYMGQQIADQFVLGADATITDVGWFGSYLLEDLAPTVTNIDFTVRFFTELGGMPVIDPFHTASVSASVTDSGVVFQGRKIYEFSADLGSPVPVLGGISYWISILETDPSTVYPTMEWRWANSDPGGFNAVRYADVTGWGSQATGSRSQSAFSLHSETNDPIPEPSTVLLLGSGLLVLVGLGRKKFKK